MRYLLVVCGIIGTLAFSTTDVTAQDNTSWPVTCVDRKNPQTCRMSQIHNATKVVDGKTQNIGKVLALTVLYAVSAKTKKRTPYLSIQMPLGVNLVAGAAMKVDENKDIKLTFLQCTMAGCDASVELTSKVLRSLLAGIEITVGFKAWGGDQTSLVKASLTGFTKAFRKLK